MSAGPSIAVIAFASSKDRCRCEAELDVKAASAPSGYATRLPCGSCVGGRRPKKWRTGWASSQW